jgi:hypothetical protein
VLHALGDEGDALVLVGELGIVVADLLDEAAVTRRTGVGDDDVVVGALLGAGAGKAEFQRHSSVLRMISR